MVDFGEELFTVDSYRIPWLIWIQMLIFFLLLLLLYAFGVFSSDLSDYNSSSSSGSIMAAAPSTSGASLFLRFPSRDRVPVNRGSRFFVNSSLVQSNQMGGSESIKGEITASTTRRVVRGENTKAEEEGEACSTENLEHPCNLFQMAGSAFLKCLGLDRTTAEDSRIRRPESRKDR